MQRPKRGRPRTAPEIQQVSRNEPAAHTPPCLSGLSASQSKGLPGRGATPRPRPTQRPASPVEPTVRAPADPLGGGDSGAPRGRAAGEGHTLLPAPFSPQASALSLVGDKATSVPQSGCHASAPLQASTLSMEPMGRVSEETCRRGDPGHKMFGQDLREERTLLTGHLHCGMCSQAAAGLDTRFAWGGGPSPVRGGAAARR